MDFNIQAVSDAPVLTKKQIAHVKAVLKQWHVVSTDKVEYDPIYGNIVARNPKLNLDMEVLVFEHGGTSVRNWKQIDGFSVKLRAWPEPKPVVKVVKVEAPRVPAVPLKRGRKRRQ